MKVADLQDMLSLLRQLLISAGSNKPAAELADFSAALDPFRDLTAKELTKELHKLTEPPKPKATKKAAKLTAAEVDALIANVQTLYERAGTASLTPAEVEEKLQPLQQLAKNDLVRAAETLGLKGMKSKSAVVIAGEIRKRIEARMGAGQRMEMIEVVVGGE